MILKILCITATIFLMLFINKHFIENETETYNLVLFKDNGNRIKIAEKPPSLPSDTTPVECNFKTVIKCKISALDDCFACKETLSTCIHFNENVNIYDSGHKNVVGVVTANSTADEGYCLRLEDKEKRTCSFKNGGRWIIVERDDRYTYVCTCTNPEIFSRTTLHGDCDHFNFCRNGKIANNDTWKTFDDIICDCDEDYKQIVKNNKSQCIRKNIFQRHKSHLPFTKLDKKYIDDAYVGKNLNLPNPCTFNPATKTEFGPEIASVHLLNDIAFCVSTSPLHVTVLFEDDYLRNNGGRYANGVVEIAIGGPVEGTVYETHTKLPKSNKLYDNVFSGRRYSYRDITLNIPFLEETTNNLGGPGQRYEYAESMTLTERERALVYVWDAPFPKSRLPENYGNIITFVPTYASRFNTDYRAFYGTLPYTHVPLLTCDKYHIMALSKGFRKYPYLSNPLVESEYKPIDQKPPRTDDYTMPILCKNNHSKTIIQMYSKIFTGLITTYYHEDRFHTKPLSPGASIINKYRLHLDPNWSSFKDTNEAVYVTEPFPLANNLYDKKQHGETAHGIDCGENLSIPNISIARYTCDKDGDFHWNYEY